MLARVLLLVVHEVGHAVAAIEGCQSALSNLVPRTVIGAPGARDEMANDGLGIVRSLFGPPPS